VERAREQTYEQRPGWWLGTVAQDVRYALRGFRRNPVFTIAVIATLAVGIGATTAVFSVVDRILFRRCRMRTTTGWCRWGWCIRWRSRNS
jgi:putative ABC transport system permease protein